MRKYGILLLVLLFSGCDINNNGWGSYTTNAEAAQKIRNRSIGIETVVIDSCEYLFTSTLPWKGDFALTHKGNCTFCKNRQR